MCTEKIHKHTHSYTHWLIMCVCRDSFFFSSKLTRYNLIMYIYRKSVIIIAYGGNYCVLRIFYLSKLLEYIEVCVFVYRYSKLELSYS